MDLYLNLDKERLFLYNQPQAFYMEQSNGDYAIRNAEGYYLDAKDGNNNNGIVGYKPQKGREQKFRLFTSDKVSTKSSMDLAGKNFYIGSISDRDDYRIIMLPWMNTGDNGAVAAANYNYSGSSTSERMIRLVFGYFVLT